MADTQEIEKTDSSGRQLERYVSPMISGCRPQLSVVVPVMNEEATLEDLVRQIANHVPAEMIFEVIFIDDGSTDDSWMVIQALADLYPGIVTGIRFRTNRGKAAGLQAGFDAAAGEIVFTMDADLQDDPTEIPRFLEKLAAGYDLVSGWRQIRNDPWHKVLPSRVFNQMLSYFSGVQLHDHNCGFKCYRSHVIKSVHLFGELHRMVPSLAGNHGFRVTEIPVVHHARKFGESKYGVERFIGGFSDMLTVAFLWKFRERPSHFVNAVAAGYGLVALTCLCIGLLVGITSVAGILCAFMALSFVGMGGMCVVAGLLSEVMIRVGHNSVSPVATKIRHQPQSGQSAPASHDEVAVGSLGVSKGGPAHEDRAAGVVQADESASDMVATATPGGEL